MGERREQASGLSEALLAAQLEVERIAKESKNNHHSYRYTSAEAMIAYARPLLTRHGLVLRAKGHRYIDLGTEEEPGPEKGDPNLATKVMAVEATFFLMHVPSRESDEWTHQLMACPSKGRPWDKASLGTQTELLGYALRDLLLIDRGDDQPSVSGRDDSDYRARSGGKPGKPASSRKSGQGKKSKPSKIEGLQNSVVDRAKEYSELMGKGLMVVATEVLGREIRTGDQFRSLGFKELGQLNAWYKKALEAAHADAQEGGAAETFGDDQPWDGPPEPNGMREPGDDDPDADGAHGHDEMGKPL